MISGSIGWVRFDQREYDQAAEARALLITPGTRDEMGLGGIRDRFADAMFPGTSTIQTRLRYAIFVGWTYDALINLPAEELISRGRKEELATIGRLQRGKAGNGIIGARAGDELVRLPSMSYWTLLQNWRDQSVDARPLPSRSSWISMSPSERVNWPLVSDSYLRPAFRQAMDFELTKAEAEYLHNRLAAREKGGPRSLFHELLRGEAALDAENTDMNGIETHDLRNSRILHNAKAFSQLTWGASLAYNILLLERRIKMVGRTKTVREDEEILADRQKEWNDWMDTDREENARLILDPAFFILPDCLRDEAITFVKEWAQNAATVVQPASLYTLIAARERHLKSPAQRRFQSDRALSRWSGASDINPATFRWATARTFLSDLDAEGFRDAAGRA